MSLHAMLSALWQRRLGPLLLITQVALSLVVLANVAYIIAVRFETTGRPTGLALHEIFWIASQGYSAAYHHEAAVRADLEYLNHLPGVIAAASGNAIPQTFSGLRSRVAALPEDRGREAGEIAIVYQMSDRAVEALGVKLVSGRALRLAALIGPPTVDHSAGSSSLGAEAVITAVLARKLFGDPARALGRPLFLSLARGQPVTVAGVIERLQAAPYFAPGSEFVEQAVLTPSIPAGPSIFYLVRAESRQRRDELMARVGKEFELRQPGRYVSRIEALAETAARGRAKARGSAIILAILSGFVLSVVMLGLFGFAMFTVTRRTREIGILRALGSRRVDVLSYVLLENGLILSAGVALGSLLSFAAGMQISLFLQLPRLPLGYLFASIAAIFLAGILAVLLPARRAARIAPATASRMA